MSSRSSFLSYLRKDERLHPQKALDGGGQFLDPLVGALAVLDRLARDHRLVHRRPVPSTAFSRSRGSISTPRYLTVAFSLAKFTLAFWTPGTFSRARSTRPTQLAQVMPVTGIVIRSSRFVSLIISMSNS